MYVEFKTFIDYESFYAIKIRSLLFPGTVHFN